MKTRLIPTRLSKTLRNEDGQALIITLVSLTVLLGFFGLAVDLGYMFYTKRQLQVAADAAALAGASSLVAGTPALATIKALANNDAALNGVVTGSNGFTVTVTWPYTPASLCAGCSANNYVEVAVSQTKQTGFMSLFGTNPTTVAARAVAFAENSPGCIFTLNPTMSDAFYLNALLVGINAPNCAIYDNSNSASAFAAGIITPVKAKYIGVVGGVSSGFFSSITPPPVTGIVPVPDPLAYLPGPPIPNWPACLPSGLNFVASSTNLPSPGKCYSTTSATPALTISGTTAAPITLTSGTYYIDGGGKATGGLLISGTSVTAKGVTFCIRNGGTFNISGSLISGTGVTLTAPGPSGTYPGILIYQDRADNGSAQFGGFASSLDLEGAVYVPAGSLTFPTAITGTVTNFSIFDVNSIQWVGLLGLFNDYTLAPGSGGTSPIKTVVLTE
jgi:Flp pilus assembly protein TadG